MAEEALHHMDPLDGQKIAAGLTLSSAQASVVENGYIQEQAEPKQFNYLSGWRLHVSTIVLCLGLFLANFEVSIVSTSLIAITNNLQGFSKSSWIVTAYLLTYTGFIIIWSKLSDIFGRKLTQIISLFIFLAFSGACGAAQNVEQLIICRAFQGIGGSGTYSIAMIIFFELVPTIQFAKYASLISSVFAVSYLLGPLAGGAINVRTTWRWVFLLNVPAGAVAIVLLLMTLPTDFPYQGQNVENPHKDKRLLSTKSLQRIDLLGATFLLTASLLLVCALQEVGIEYEWSSALVISFLVISGVLWIAFLAWEWHITQEGSKQEPVFPWRFVKNRIWIGMLLNTFLVGAPYTVAIVQIPQRFQAVNGVSPLGAGIRLLPLAFSSPFASFLSAIMSGKLKVPPIFLLFIGSALQTVGAALLSTIPTEADILAAQYGYEVILGFGLGTSIATLLSMVPFAVERRDQGRYTSPQINIARPNVFTAVAMGAITQFRAMGGAAGLAIVTSVMNSSVKSALSQQLSSDQLTSILQTAGAIDLLPPTLENTTRQLFAHEYDLQMRIITGFGAAQCLATGLMWQKRPIRRS